MLTSSLLSVSLQNHIPTQSGRRSTSNSPSLHDQMNFMAFLLLMTSKVCSLVHWPKHIEESPIEKQPDEIMLSPPLIDLKSHRKTKTQSKNIFYRYLHGHCSQEIREIIPAPPTPEAQLIHTLSKFHFPLHELYLTNHHSSQERAIHATLAFFLLS